MPTPKITGVATSTVAFRMAWTWPAALVGGACDRRENAFSTTTTEPSTMSPIAIASPPRLMRLADKPTAFMIKKVMSGVRIRVATTIRLERTSPKNKNKTKITSTTPSASTLETVQIAESISSDRS